MGAGASFVPEERKVREEENDSYNYPRRQMSSNRQFSSYMQQNSTRSAKTLSSVNTTRSVRAMALLNHSRHENSYMSADELSNHIRQRRQDSNSISIGLRSEASSLPPTHPHHPHLEKMPTRKIVEAADESIEPTNSKKSDSENKTREEDDYIEENELLQTHVSVKSLRAFRNNFNLKLDLENEADWGHVSDDDPEGLEDSNLHTFDKHLIEIPLGESNPSLKPSPSSEEKSEEVLQILPKDLPNMASNSSDQMTTIQAPEGGITFGHQGIIRADRPPDKNGKLTMRERLVILCKLGAGASSAVYKALDLTDMRLVALKTIQVYEKEKRVQMVREVSALFQLLRENSRRETSQYKNFKKPERYIVDFYDAFSNPEDGVVCLMIEYMDGGSLQDIVDQGGCDDETTLANIAVQALKGLSFLHSCSQIHRDLKPGNFLISHRGEVKVADLGIMKQLPQKVPGKLQKTNTFVGTATYMSPERIDGKDYSFPADIWAFGLSLATIAMGKLPIDTRGGYWTILHGIRDEPSPSLPADRFSPEFCDFVNQCLKKNPDERSSCKELLKHPFLLKAEPEDLTVDQDDERGKYELSTILKALVKHIETLKKIYRDKYKSNIEKYKEHTSVLHEKLFGNLLEDSTEQILRRVIFYDQNNQNNKNAVSGKHRLTKPRLNTISRQLNLPLDVVIRESKLFCDGFAND